MSRTTGTKKIRQSTLVDRIREDPFLTDEELSEIFNVSIPTIRLDRLELGIPELRERLRHIAEENSKKVKSIQKKEVVGEILDITLNKYAVSIFETNETMVFERSRIVRGSHIYSLAESTAMAVIDSDVALVGVANIKYKIPVNSGTRLVAKAEVKEIRRNSYIVWVKISEKNNEVFRGKFILVSLEKTGNSN